MKKNFLLCILLLTSAYSQYGTLVDSSNDSIKNTDVGSSNNVTQNTVGDSSQNSNQKSNLATHHEQLILKELPSEASHEQPIHEGVPSEASHEQPIHEGLPSKASHEQPTYGQPTYGQPGSVNPVVVAPPHEEPIKLTAAKTKPSVSVGKYCSKLKSVLKILWEGKYKAIVLNKDLRNNDNSSLEKLLKKYEVLAHSSDQINSPYFLNKNIKSLIPQNPGKSCHNLIWMHLWMASFYKSPSQFFEGEFFKRIQENSDLTYLSKASEDIFDNIYGNDDYIPFSDLLNSEELIKNIENIDYKKYERTYESKDITLEEMFKGLTQHSIVSKLKNFAQKYKSSNTIYKKIDIFNNEILPICDRLSTLSLGQGDICQEKVLEPVIKACYLSPKGAHFNTTRCGTALSQQFKGEIFKTLSNRHKETERLAHSVYKIKPDNYITSEESLKI